MDKASRSDFLEGYDIPVKYLTNWNDPRTWWATAKAIVALKPDKVIIQWYNPTQGIPLNTIAKYLRKHCKQTEILFKVEQIEQSINRGGRWTRDDMSRFTSEVKLLNPDIKFPDLTSIGSSGN